MNHCSKDNGEPCRTVPVLTENCFLQPVHLHDWRVERNEVSPHEQKGRITPPGQRISRKNSHAFCGLLNFFMAAMSVAGIAMVDSFMVLALYRYSGDLLKPGKLVSHGVVSLVKAVRLDDLTTTFQGDSITLANLREAWH